MNREPMVHINGTDYGVKLSTIVQTIIVLIPMVGAWYNLNNGQLDLKDDVVELKENIRQYKIEGANDRADLRNKTQNTREDIARLQEQLKNLQLLLGDLKKQGFNNGSEPGRWDKLPGKRNKPSEERHEPTWNRIYSPIHWDQPQSCQTGVRIFNQNPRLD